jgi:hypothetical protein
MRIADRRAWSREQSISTNMPPSGRIGRSPATPSSRSAMSSALATYCLRIDAAVGKSCVKAKAVMSEAKGHFQGKQV